MIAIIDYRAGNPTSVRLALETIGVEGEITQDPGRVLAAERVIFPGVGAAGAAMGNLAELGLVGAICDVVQRGTPMLAAAAHAVRMPIVLIKSRLVIPF